MSLMLAALLLVSQPAQTPAGEMSCEAIGNELRTLVRSALSGTQEQIRLADAGQRTLADEAVSQVGGLVSGFIPGPASGIAATVMGAATHAREMQLQREGEAAQRRIDEIDAEQDGVTERIGVLNNEFQRRCTARPAH